MRKQFLIALAGMLLSARNIGGALKYVSALDPKDPEMEKKVEKLEGKVDRLDEKLVRLQATYEVLLDQAREHGWTIPWQGRRR